MKKSALADRPRRFWFPKNVGTVFENPLLVHCTTQGAACQGLSLYLIEGQYSVKTECPPLDEGLKMPC